MLFARKAQPIIDRALLPLYDAWMDQKLKGVEVSVQQAPIASPIVQTDPELLTLRPPPHTGGKASGVSSAKAPSWFPVGTMKYI